MVRSNSLFVFIQKSNTVEYPGRNRAPDIVKHLSSDLFLSSPPYPKTKIPLRIAMKTKITSEEVFRLQLATHYQHAVWGVGAIHTKNANKIQPLPTMVAISL